LDQPVPHPTTLSKLVRRCGPDTIAALNTALLAKLADDKLLRCRKLRVDTTVVAANVAYPTDVGLLARAIAKLAPPAGGCRPPGARPGPDPGSSARGAPPGAGGRAGAAGTRR
jgi:transposase, IS5 family